VGGSTAGSNLTLDLAGHIVDSAGPTATRTGSALSTSIHLEASNTTIHLEPAGTALHLQPALRSPSCWIQELPADASTASEASGAPSVVPEESTLGNTTQESMQQEGTHDSSDHSQQGEASGLGGLPAAGVGLGNNKSLENSETRRSGLLAVGGGLSNDKSIGSSETRQWRPGEQGLGLQVHGQGHSNGHVRHPSAFSNGDAFHNSNSVHTSNGQGTGNAGQDVARRSRRGWGSRATGKSGGHGSSTSGSGSSSSQAGSTSSDPDSDSDSQSQGSGDEESETVGRTIDLDITATHNSAFTFGEPSEDASSASPASQHGSRHQQEQGQVKQHARRSASLRHQPGRGLGSSVSGAGNSSASGTSSSRNSDLSASGSRTSESSEDESSNGNLDSDGLGGTTIHSSSNGTITSHKPHVPERYMSSGLDLVPYKRQPPPLPFLADSGLDLLGNLGAAAGPAQGPGGAHSPADRATPSPAATAQQQQKFEPKCDLGRATGE
jgi:hypothetical protein